jgi:hypothetical protein
MEREESSGTRDRNASPIYVLRFQRSRSRRWECGNPEGIFEDEGNDGSRSFGFYAFLNLSVPRST